MARSTAAFERVISVAIARLKPPEAQKRHAEIARKGLADHLAKTKGAPQVVTFVDGRLPLLWMRSRSSRSPAAWASTGMLAWGFHR